MLAEPAIHILQRSFIIGYINFGLMINLR